jgi:TRAP-type C4-dicarboxylate transport system substrate-binding protein
MKKLAVAALASLLASCIAFGPKPATSQEVTLRVHSFLPPVANPMKHFVTPWAQKVEKESNGRIKVQVFPSMQLGGKAEQMLAQVRDGVVDVVWTLPGFTPGVMPKLEIFELPFLHRSTNATVRRYGSCSKAYEGISNLIMCCWCTHARPVHDQGSN